MTFTIEFNIMGNISISQVPCLWGSLWHHRLCSYALFCALTSFSWAESCNRGSIAPETSALLHLLCWPLKCASLMWWEFSRGKQYQSSSSSQGSAAKALQWHGPSVYCPGCLCNAQYSKGEEGFLQASLKERITTIYTNFNWTTSTLKCAPVRYAALSTYLNYFCSCMHQLFSGSILILAISPSESLIFFLFVFSFCI